MTAARLENRKLKGDPAGALAAAEGLAGFVTRTRVLGGSPAAEKEFVERQVAGILDGQSDNGSWKNTIVDTTGEIARLLMCGVLPRHKAVRKGRNWLLGQQVSDGSVWHDLFCEPTTADRRRLRKRYAGFHPHVPSDFCCGVNRATATCCVLECLFDLGDDVSTNPRLASALNRLLALGNVYGGICGAGFGRLDARSVKPYPKRGLWTRRDNRVFRRECEVNPGVTICAHFLMRAVARSRDLASSPLVKSALTAWQAHQLADGSFDTKYYQYDFYFALDTLSLYAKRPEARRMVTRMLPSLLRRQRRDGRWWRRGDWVEATFSAVWSLHRFDLLEQMTDPTARDERGD